MKFWLDAKKFVTKEYIKKLHMPVLIVYGGNDPALADSKILFENANEPKKLVIINGANHGYDTYEHLEEFIKVVVDWFKNGCPKFIFFVDSQNLLTKIFYLMSLTYTYEET